MKTLHFPTKPYSWLQWPATLKGLKPEHHAHLTLKFFGEAYLDVEAITSRVAGHVHESWRPQDFEWKTEIWQSPKQQSLHYVLAFTKFPTIITFQHKLFNIIRNQYDPWTPHISVTKEYLMMVEDQAFTPAECELTFGEIELCLGGPNVE